MGESTYIADLMKILKKYIWLIVLLAILGGVGGKILTGASPAPTYQTAVLVLIKQQPVQSNVIINQSDETNRFMNTAQTLVYTPVILKKVKEDLHLKETTKELARMVKTGIENGSQILRITVEDKDRSNATELANGIADAFQQEIGNYLDVASVQIVEKAQKGQETQILQTRSKANMIMGVVMGLVFGVFLSLLLSYFRKPSRV